MISSLYNGAMGMIAHSTGMGVVGNNLANVNTTGFKRTDMLFSDMVGKFLTAGSNNVTNYSQAGGGVAVGATRTIYSETAFEQGSEPTDIGILGGGFFGVTSNGQMHYTRAGNFRFTADGHLVDPSGWSLMGYPINDGSQSNVVEAIQLNFSSMEGGKGYIPGSQTTQTTLLSQLGGLSDMNENAANPYFAMASSWNGTNTPPIGPMEYSYREPFNFYDTTGTLRTAYVYYDLAGQQNGMKVAEYMVAMDPDLDASSLAGTNAAGLLMSGTMTFSSTGQLMNVTAFVPTSGDPANLSTWVPASLQDGSPVFTVTPAGAGSQGIALNMGLTLTTATNGLATAADASANPSAIFSASDGSTLQSRSSTIYGTSNGSLLQQSDGYGEGFLYNLMVTEEGLLQAAYTNGETLDLYRIPLYRFPSQDGLRHEGSNHFSATQESGAAEAGIPGEENFGALTAYALEQSNVDYAQEFATMIVTQRGFQMNSKVVQTADTMLQKALEMKR